MTLEEEKRAAQKKRRGKGKNFSLWLSPEQETKLLARTEASAAPCPSAFIKNRIFDTEFEPIRIRRIKQADPALIRQLSWIGNNLNQIARVTNCSAALSPLEAAQVYAALSLIAEDIEALGEMASA